MVNRKDILVLVVVWAALTALGIIVATSLPIFPAAASREAEFVDRAFTTLAVLAAPVFSLVVVLLVYSVIRFRRKGTPGEDGPAITGNVPLVTVWVMATLGLALFVAINPGLTGMAELRAHREADMVVEVRSRQWEWEFHYPKENIQSLELRLPAGKRVRFEITALDTLHSFWVPEFRVKQDAVPGQTQILFTTPTGVGRFEAVCAELCGLGHTIMRSPVIVMPQAEFDSWIAGKRAAATGAISGATVLTEPKVGVKP